MAENRRWMMKRFLAVAICAMAVPALAAAAVQARYRIILQNGTQVVSRDQPMRHGSVVTFHDARSGVLTGVPAEEIVRIETGAATVAEPAIDVLVHGDRAALAAPAQPMLPGDVVEIGPTGGGPALIPNGSAYAAGQAQNGTGGNGNGAYANGALANGQAPMGAYGGAVGQGRIGPNGQPVTTAVPGSTASVVTGEPPTIGPNGFPVMNGNPPTVGPNGTVISSSDQPVIGANGTPVLAGASSTVTAIGPNGTPALAQPGSPVSSQPAIGPNGTPVLAQPGTPGSAQPVIGPNGTPVLAQPGQPGSVQPGAPGSAQPVIGPNGTPLTAPAGSPGGPAAGPNPQGNAPQGGAPNGAAAAAPPGHR
jgi:hypothetical protein